MPVSYTHLDVYKRQDTKGAIGYVALSYLVDNDDVDTVAIDGVEPTLENTYSGDYKVWTFEHMYTNGEPDKATKAFLDYIMGEKFGKKMESSVSYTHLCTWNFRLV